MTAVKSTPIFEMNLTIRDIAHLNTVCKYINEEVGQGKTNWCMAGKVVKPLKRSGKPCPVRVLFFTEIKPEALSLIALL